jgi:hypothetical protein
MKTKIYKLFLILSLSVLLPSNAEAGLACYTFTGTIIDKESFTCETGNGNCYRHKELTSIWNTKYHTRVFIKVITDYSEDSHWYEIDYSAYQWHSGRKGTKNKFWMYYNGYIRYAEQVEE